MPQFGWTLAGNRKSAFHLGLYHGDRTGHVVIHCNSRIVTIDFGVRRTKTYSFFLDDELCEVTITHNGGNTYTYSCEINKEAATPLNEARRAKARSDWRNTVLFVTGFCAVVILITVLFSMTGRPDRAELMAELQARGGVRTHVRIVKTSEGQLHYSFRAGSSVIEGRIKSSGRPLLPLESGDEFELRYQPGHPDIHLIDWSRPTSRQADRYLQRVIERHASLNPQLSERQVRCQVRAAWRYGGLAALADFYYQDRPPALSSDHDRDSYLQLRQSPSFQHAARCR